MEVLEKREQIMNLKANVLQAEQERISGAKTISIQEARKGLRERIIDTQELDKNRLSDTADALIAENMEAFLELAK